jgi:threonine/homoserine/homoserine lactone efflux protein
MIFITLDPKDINSKNISSKSFFSFFKDGFLVAGTSPKAWMFFPLIFPQFIDFNSNYLVQFIILITTYVVLDFSIFDCLCLTSSKIN